MTKGIEPRLKVLVSAYACLPNAGTEPGNGWNWATHLAARGMEIHVLTRRQNRDRIEEHLRNNPCSGVHFYYPDAFPEFIRPTTGVHYFLWQLAALKMARRLALTNTFDIVHHVTYGSVHVPSQLWRLGIPFIFGPVGGGQTPPADMLAYFGRSRTKERLRSLLTSVLRYSFLHRLWFKRASLVLATNGETVALLKSLGCEARLYFDTGLPESFFAQAPRSFDAREGPLRLLWVGRMLPRKALPLTLDAVSLAHSDLTLTIIGDGLDAATIEKMISDRGLEGRVTWLGRQDWLKVREAYLEHDAMLFTSLRDSCAAQLLESMALGLPVITLDLHGAHDLVPEHAGFKVKVTTRIETVRAIAQAIDRYSALPREAREMMSRVAWSFARTLSWPTRAQFAESLYRRLLVDRS